ncbi:hypothetical protein AB0K12_24875 [Nonomuraea sp. NPDC049419]|uniref:hypothetical protein n=1 Tax=Nonomuraea sp. NPDC049419 TaxID=3155772 RepID=UPI00342B1227
MAMPKKGSRRITVGGGSYRWRVRRKPSYSQGNGWTPLTFAVERAEEPGNVLVVSLPCARPDNWLGHRTIPVTPALVAACVRRALERGWDPGRSGSAVTLEVSEDDLTHFLGEPPRYLIPFLWGFVPADGTASA